MVKGPLVKIIPRAKPGVSLYLNFIPFISLFLLAAVIFVSFILERQVASLQEKKEKLEESLAYSQVEKDLEQKMFVLSEKIEDFAKLWKEHKKVSNFFELLKSLTHPKVQFLSLELNTTTREVKLSGKTETLKTLAEQILILKSQEHIENLKANNISLDSEGEVNFNLTFNFSEELIRR